MAKRKATNNTGKKYQRRQYDPRVDMFKNFYINPSSYTFMNARQSALRAGYTEQYANNITTQQPSWFVELIDSMDHKRAELLKNSENNLFEVVTGDDRDEVSRKKLKIDVSKFISERLGKDHYSTRKEITDKDGRRLFNDTAKERTEALEDLFIGVSSAPQAVPVSRKVDKSEE